MTDTRRVRARASLLGLSVGDAFGETMFGPPGTIERRVAKRLIAVTRPWRWTDDTAMALSVVEVLDRHDAIDCDALAAAFVRRWTAEPGRGYGQGAFELFTKLGRGATWRDEAPRLFRGQGSFGNGAAMRAAPIGAYFAGDLPRVCVEAARSALPTHAHPSGQAGAVAVALAASLATTGTAAAALLPEVARHLPPGRVRDGIERAAALGLALDPVIAGDALGTGCDIAAHDTVPFALWVAARHLGSFEDALWTATSQVGDLDTLGAIVGGIVVMATGVDGIPVLWRAAAEPLPADAVSLSRTPPGRDLVT